MWPKGLSRSSRPLPSWGRGFFSTTRLFNGSSWYRSVWRLLINGYCQNTPSRMLKNTSKLQSLINFSSLTQNCFCFWQNSNIVFCFSFVVGNNQMPCTDPNLRRVTFNRLQVKYSIFKSLGLIYACALHAYLTAIYFKSWDTTRNVEKNPTWK